MIGRHGGGFGRGRGGFGGDAATGLPSGPIQDPQVLKVIERLHTTRRVGGGGGAVGGPRGGGSNDPELYADVGFSIHPTQGDLMYLLCPWGQSSFLKSF